MELRVNIVAASIGKENGVKIPTMELEYPRVALAEFNTHRVFTRNGQSSRAVPFPRMVEAMRANHHSPLRWLKNQPGMTATEVMLEDDAAECEAIWLETMEFNIAQAERLNAKHASKQYVNRLLEPWLMTKTLVTSTRWANFFKLRDHKDALPEFRELAAMMKEAFDKAEFIERSAKEPMAGWHLPYIKPQDWDTVREAVIDGGRPDPIEIPSSLVKHMSMFLPQDVGLSHPGMRTLIMMSVARCCRLSYKTFDTGVVPTLDQDYATFKKLATDPLHASPMEHVAFPLTHKLHVPGITGNFHGMRQLRKIMPNEAVEEAIL